MRSCSYHTKAYKKALGRKCLNPSVGNLLDDFNKLLEQENKELMADYHNMIQHLIDCRPCRKQLLQLGQSNVSRPSQYRYKQ